MKTIREILPQAVQFLRERKISNARLSSEEILAFAMGTRRLDLYLNFDCPVKEDELVVARELLKKRAHGTPLEYILGKIDFFGVRLKITADVLIPRQETEILAELVMKEMQKQDLRDKVLWDICCGSGCLGLSLKKKFPEVKVFLSDISTKALNLAKENASQNALTVEFLEGDFIQPFAGKKADFVVCNPPYISEIEYKALDPEVREFEPKEALLSGPSGLEFYERLAKGLPSLLNPGAKVFLEIGESLGSQVKNIFSKVPSRFQEIRKDWAGKDRFFFLEIE
ncbi:MAG TPA: peptide chain release factor N(5)-glutamine methyltransferase [Chlamydiales bacterium]|nr:peptide chain release factor N(5)-glutamine methyltransferase [Chlamydiales bacterium]